MDGGETEVTLSGDSVRAKLADTLRLDPIREAERICLAIRDQVLRAIARLDGTPFPSAARVASGWLRGRLPPASRGGRRRSRLEQDGGRDEAIGGGEVGGGGFDQHALGDLDAEQPWIEAGGDVAVTIDELFGQRSFNEAQQQVGEEDAAPGGHRHAEGDQEPLLLRVGVDVEEIASREFASSLPNASTISPSVITASPLYGVRQWNMGNVHR